jgi:hypothetical protein
MNDVIKTIQVQQPPDWRDALVVRDGEGIYYAAADDEGDEWMNIGDSCCFLEAEDVGKFGPISVVIDADGKVVEAEQAEWAGAVKESAAMADQVAALEAQLRAAEERAKKAEKELFSQRFHTREALIDEARDRITELEAERDNYESLYREWRECADEHAERAMQAGWDRDSNGEWILNFSAKSAGAVEALNDFAKWAEGKSVDRGWLESQTSSLAWHNAAVEAKRRAAQIGGGE